MKERIKQFYLDLSLTQKIRAFYFLLLIPTALFLVIGFSAVEQMNRSTEEMIDSLTLASEFSLDFKKDFDYETYLLIVGNKTVEESNLDRLLEDANRVVDGLDGYNISAENAGRLKSASRYLNNLKTYQQRIEENLVAGNMYESNLEIWENDVQIVTSLVRDTIFEFIFYETKDLQAAKESNQELYRRMTIFSVCFVFIIAVGMFLVSYYIPLSITRPIRHLSSITDQVAKGDLTVRSEEYAGGEVGVLSESLNTMIDKINELVSQITDEQIRLREAELELLQSQINPHFLYNTLDTIVWLAEGGQQKEVVQMVKSLSSFFRTSISRGDDVITLRNEAEHAKSYLEIQQFRYQDILEYEISLPEELLDYRIPKITIQPLIENALYHGIKNKRGKGKITVWARRCGDDFEILVEDNGIGMDEERLAQVMDGIRSKRPSEKKIYGLYNVNERIRLKFGDDYGITLESTYREGTTTRILLPCSDKYHEEEA